MTVTNGVDADRLRSLIARVERLEEEKAAIAADIKDVYAEAKSQGYCVKTMRAIVRLRKIEADDRREQEELLELYKGALGMLADLPLGEAAIERDVSPVRKATRRMQAARPDGEPTVSINGKGNIPLGQFMTIANSLESPIGRAVAAGFIAGAKLDQQKAEAAEPTPHDPTTGEVLGDAPAPAPESLGPLRTQEEQPSPSEPRSLTDESPTAFSSSACANPAAGQEVNGQSGRRHSPEVAADEVDDRHPLIADESARHAAARRLLGHQEAAE